MQQTCAVMLRIAATAMASGCSATSSAAPTEEVLEEVDPTSAAGAASAAEGRIASDVRQLVSSTATGEHGSRYVAGVFSGTLMIGGIVVTSHGRDDIFLAHLWPNGAVAWAEAIGSDRDESDPKVSFSDGRVKLVGMTSGAVDCGQGPLNTWNTETFFLCTFERDGTPISGASFPTGRL